MIKAEWTSNDALSAEQTTHSNAHNTLNALDCISRQAAIDALMRNEPSAWNNDDYERGEIARFHEDVTTIKNVPAVRRKRKPSVQPEPRWIPCEERLPRQSEMVLITIIRKDERYNNIPFISIGYIGWSKTTWWCAHDGDCKSANVEVLAWMPLPKPYERRKE